MLHLVLVHSPQHFFILLLGVTEAARGHLYLTPALLVVFYLGQQAVILRGEAGGPHSGQIYGVLVLHQKQLSVCLFHF